MNNLSKPKPIEQKGFQIKHTYSKPERPQALEIPLRAKVFLVARTLCMTFT